MSSLVRLYIKRVYIKQTMPPVKKTMPLNPQTAAALLRKIKPAQALQIAVAGYSSGRLELAAPLAPNLNDKGTAFAGSISSMLVLAGWGLVTLHLREAGIQAEVVVSKSETDYKRPVRAELRGVAEADAKAFDQLIAELAENPRASIQIQIQIQLLSAGTLCATLTAQYVVSTHS
jgi:thioesterase domain-containing protein